MIMRRIDPSKLELEERLVTVNRVAKLLKVVVVSASQL